MRPGPLDDLVLDGATIVTCDDRRRVLSNGWIAVSDGVVTGTGVGDPPGAVEPVNCSGDLILPGFVNTHAHILGALGRGMGTDKALGGGVGKSPSMAIRLALRDESSAWAAARLAILDMLMSGVTTTTDSQPALRDLESQADGTLRALTESGMRALFFRASIDRTDSIPESHRDDAGRAAGEYQRLSDRWASGRIVIGLEAMALHRVSDRLPEGLSQLTSETGAPFGIHGPYSSAAASHPIERWGEPSVIALDRFGLLSNRLLMYHPVILSDREIDLLVQMEAGLAACPVDTMLLGGSSLPMDSLISRGARVGLGIDQPNDGHDMIQLMKVSILEQRRRRGDVWGSPETAIEPATIGGARALHMESSIGSIEAGKAADLVVFDGGHPSLNPPRAALSNIVYAASPGAIRAVFVGGERVVDGGSHLRWSAETVVAEARLAAAEALRRAGLSTDLFTTWPMS